MSTGPRLDRKYLKPAQWKRENFASRSRRRKRGLLAERRENALGEEVTGDERVHVQANEPPPRRLDVQASSVPTRGKHAFLVQDATVAPGRVFARQSANEFAYAPAQTWAADRPHDAALFSLPHPTAAARRIPTSQ
jgi:hypothetical protein